MALTVTGSFECFSSVDLCESECVSGKCYFVDVCNGESEAFFCSTFNPYVFLFGSLTGIAAFLLLCFGGALFCIWKRIRSFRKKTFALPVDHPITVQMPKPADPEESKLPV
ncbi:hypothetical protein QR680_017029 [Steinernema hermaphroditum]|uniref:Uncharacterized protein n=1 Tax=Steinernema hermaphroditum TaxID=289476 RepID=A0AA39HD21_9BILA|nr:hypothetical protein QR680_017029 [Steinernema hermaphroditum]